MTANELEQKLLAGLPDAAIRAQDMTGGGDHWQVRIRAPQFKGKSMVEQHQMVYAILGDLMKSEIHALSLDTDES